MCLALRASGLWLRYATLQNLIPSFPWIAPPRPPPWPNPRKGRDQILPSGNLVYNPNIPNLRSAVQTLSQAATQSSAAGGPGMAASAASKMDKMEAVRKLVGYIMRIQVCQTNILQASHNSKVTQYRQEVVPSGKKGEAKKQVKQAFLSDLWREILK